jgi:hypothetical protein
MFGARARFSARLNLAAIRNVAPQASKILIVDLRDVVDAKRTDLAAIEAAIVSARSRPAGRPTRTRTSVVS